MLHPGKKESVSQRTLAKLRWIKLSVMGKGPLNVVLELCLFCLIVSTSNVFPTLAENSIVAVGAVTLFNSVGLDV